MGLFSFLNRAGNYVLCSVRGANPALFLSACASHGLVLHSTEPIDDFSLQFTAALRDVEILKSCALKCNCELEIRHAGGLKKGGKKLLYRIAPVACFVLFVALLVWSKLFIWEIDVSGNKTVSSSKIMDGLRECGITYGSFWPGITSDNLRSELLIEVPELAWATVNIYGSRAECIVRERVPKPAMFDAHAPTDIVAAKTGFVTKVFAMNGTPLVEKGSAVLAGETLISGVGHSSFSPDRLLHAVGEIEAETYYEFSAVLPKEQQYKTPTAGGRSRWSILIGKNRYNFYGNSSICAQNCDKIISVWNCGVKGLFQLPVSLVREKEQGYTLGKRLRDENGCCRNTEELLHGYLIQNLDPGGMIETEYYSSSQSDEVLSVCLRARCSERIGIEKPMAASQIQKIQEARNHDGTHHSSGQN